MTVDLDAESTFRAMFDKFLGHQEHELFGVFKLEVHGAVLLHVTTPSPQEPVVFVVVADIVRAPIAAEMAVAWVVVIVVVIVNERWDNYQVVRPEVVLAEDKVGERGWKPSRLLDSHSDGHNILVVEIVVAAAAAIVLIV